MIRIYQNTKVYVYCPAGVVTGGAELLHQLVDRINSRGGDAYIVYLGGKNCDVIPEQYKLYNIKIAKEVEDIATNVEVIYEGRFDLIHNNSKIQKFLWWLSVDHFYMYSVDFLSYKDMQEYSSIMAIKGLIRRIGMLLFRHKNLFRQSISLDYLRSLNATNGYQSEYACHFLKQHQFNNLVALKDYINTDYQTSLNYKSSSRKNIILYNPKKGYKYLQTLIKETSDLTWIPLKNMTRKELIELMQKSKLYVDFGYHPGKDRLPRECAMNGCCIITGMKGSAAFYGDIAIPDKYKFDEKHISKNEIVTQIKWVLNNYDVAIQDFEHYRAEIAKEKTEFEKQVDVIFL